MNDTKEQKLEKKVAIITGGASGIGRATAILFAQEGAKVVVADINGETGKVVVQEILGAGGQAIFVKVNVAIREDTVRMAQEAMKEYGKIDILINNSGIVQDALITKMTEEQWDKVIGVNLTGPFNCIQAVVGVMTNQGSGVIVNTSSVVALYGNIGQVNYAAAKAGLIGMTKTLAKELGRKGIRVNAVAPGFIQTPMTAGVPEKILEVMKEKTPLKRLGTPLDVAKAYLFLASEDAGFVNGSILSVDGGLVI